MREQVAKILNVEDNYLTNEHITKIVNELGDRSVTEELVLEINQRLRQAGTTVFTRFVEDITRPPAPRVLLIKSSPKGVRIKDAAPDGVRYSFGPVWNLSVSRGKGIALSEANRPKLNHQGLLAGIEAPEKLSVQELAAAIAATFTEA